MAAILLVSAVAIMFAGLCSAEDHSIGPWNLKRTKEDYKAWSQMTKFVAGDTLKFEYAAGTHNVYALATQEAYDKCDTSKPVKTFTDANPIVQLATPGKKFYVCAVGNHCDQGMKVTINVLSASAASPSPSAAAPDSGAIAYSASFFSTVCFAVAAAFFGLF